MSRNGKKNNDQEGGEVQARGQPDSDSADEAEGKKKKGMFGKLKSGAGNLATFVTDTAKETLVTTVLGDDMGEAVLEAKDNAEEVQEELATDSEKESDDDDESHRDERKDRQSGGKQQSRQRSSRARRYDEDWDDGDDWNYERQKSWR